MKRAFFLYILCMMFITSMNSQNTLPTKFSVIPSFGLSIPYVEGNKNDFFNRNGNKLGYSIGGEMRFFFSENIACGVKYDYIRTKNDEDKMHINFIAPEIVFRYVFYNDRSAVFIGLAPGYLNYAEKIRNSADYQGHVFDKSYFGMDFSLGYEFSIVNNISGIAKINLMTADWKANPDARLFNPDPDYDDGINHNWFKNNITFFNVGFALQFGK